MKEELKKIFFVTLMMAWILFPVIVYSFINKRMPTVEDYLLAAILVELMHDKINWLKLRQEWD